VDDGLLAELKTYGPRRYKTASVAKYLVKEALEDYIEILKQKEYRS